jgi:hypothetical protein
MLARLRLEEIPFGNLHGYYFLSDFPALGTYWIPKNAVAKPM